MVGRELTPGRHVQGTCRPCRHSTEHVAGNGVDGVGRDFGPLLGQIGKWAQNEVCSSHDALQL